MIQSGIFANKSNTNDIYGLSTIEFNEIMN